MQGRTSVDIKIQIGNPNNGNEAGKKTLEKNSVCVCMSWLEITMPMNMEWKGEVYPDEVVIITTTKVIPSLGSVKCSVRWLIDWLFTHSSLTLTLTPTLTLTLTLTPTLTLTHLLISFISVALQFVCHRPLQFTAIAEKCK